MTSLNLQGKACFKPKKKLKFVMENRKILQSKKLKLCVRYYHVYFHKRSFQMYMKLPRVKQPHCLKVKTFPKGSIIFANHLGDFEIFLLQMTGLSKMPKKYTKY